MKKIIITSVLLVSVSLLIGQQGKYVRKSVSSLESVWFKPGSVAGLEFDSKTFDKFIDFYVEICAPSFSLSSFLAWQPLRPTPPS